ncbi:GGDEF domain-containing protein [Thermosulfurimonas marina]|uniref:diguanylate cyclase n=1 Tax=Thermosulfurimonas marina TaxID=2047767 RepID=A0A6H1WSJ6_9BACT|nr:GGDEF domain-containing protein [Thermosulfurimonas marina]QJA06141.1 GGDEF domain-containing protein [Thermosulfurimonas marina]
MDLFEEFLQKEAERLRTCWTAFLNPLKARLLPLPSRYAEEFQEAEKLPPEEKENLLAELVRETREVLEWLLSHGEVREVLKRQERIRVLEEIVARLAELEEQVDYLREELLRDELTRLWNRRALQTFFPEILKRATKGREIYILAFLDLCDFKKINDRFGHQIGDRFLVQAARRLRAFTKRLDVPVRLGGDEFCLLLAAPSVEKAEPFLRDLTATPISLQVEGEEVGLYFACGATDVLGEDTLESCLHRADLAMYEHKVLLKEWLSSGAKGPPPRPVLSRAFSRDL